MNIEPLPPWVPVLRLCAIGPLIALCLLRANIAGDEVVYKWLVLIGFGAAYVWVMLAPSRFVARQIGFSLGYGISMFGSVIFLVVVGAVGMHTGPATEEWVFKFGLFANAAFAIVALLEWIANRKTLNPGGAILGCVIGLFYPIVMFFVTILLAIPFSRR